jgi:hypothetical protein
MLVSCSDKSGIIPLRCFKPKKIWETSDSLHCPIVGTCLTIDELRKLIRKSYRELAENGSDYEIHNFVVRALSEPNSVRKRLQKILERKYGRIGRQFSKAQNEKELSRLWDESIASGDVAGPFWAIATHPIAAEGLIRRMYGDVHMLSHLKGASNRVDIHRLHQLEQKNRHLEKLLAQEKTESSHRNDEQVAVIQEMAQRLERLSGVEQQLENSLSRLQLMDENKERRLFSEKITILEKSLAKTKASDRSARGKMGVLSIKNDQLQKGLAQQTQALQEERSERKSLEKNLATILTSECSVGGEAGNGCLKSGECTNNLSGRCILYVGGITHMKNHYQALVERHSGQFIHHDGGVNDGRSHLDSVMAQADVIFCPIDCISHDACLRIKRHCKRTDRMFVPLRSAGLSSFAHGLQKAVI